MFADPETPLDPGPARTVVAAPMVPLADGTPTTALSQSHPVFPTTIALSTGPGLAQETRDLLRYRLRICSWAAIVASFALLVLGFLLGQRDRADVADGAVYPNMGLLLVGLISLGLLRRRPSLRQLRAIELLLFGSLSIMAGIQRYSGFMTLPPDSPNLDYQKVAVLHANTLNNILVFFIIMYYGLLIPNTRSRGLAIVVGMGIVPLVAILAAVATNPGIRPHAPYLLLLTSLGVCIAGTGAVFGASRISQLQRQAFEARRDAQQVGAYTLKRKLGEGGMGEVFLAEHRLLKRPCAVKFIRPELAADPSTAARFEREVRAVTGLSHVNTVRVYDYGRADDGSFYYVMEYLDGPALDRLVKDHGPLPPGRAVYLLRQICGALAEAHAAGLVHRDLKPGNILVATVGGQHDVAKLLDFGLVQDVGATAADGRLTRTGTVLGTPSYLCPEQAGGEQTDARGDVYSLGAVGFFALTGRPPFEGMTVGKLLAAHLTQTPPLVSDIRDGVPADLSAVIARCLAKIPGERFQSTTELDTALAGCACATGWSAAHAARLATAVPPPTDPADPDRTRTTIRT